MRTVKIDESKWIRCGKCGHKLGRIVKGHVGMLPMIEIKCHSCRELNMLGYGRKIYDKRTDNLEQ